MSRSPTDSAKEGATRRGLLKGLAALPVAGATVATPAAGQAGGQTYTVDMTDGLVFDPDEISISPGDTIVWENVGAIGHTVTAYEDDIPEDAEFFSSGGYESEQAARDAYFADSGGNVPGGESYSHTFETEGTYEYFCIPHEAAGMLGTVEVRPGATPSQPGDGGGEAGGEPGLPGGAVGGAMMAILLGIAGLSALAVLAGESLRSIRRPGHDLEPGEVREAAAETPERTIEHDEYDPIGTATLIAIYLAIVIAMWIFVYFVEFLGNGPTVIG